MKKVHIIITALLFALGIFCYIFFEAMQIKLVADPIANKLLCGFISRYGLSILFVWLLYMFGGKDYLLFNKNFFKAMIWSLPCFMVAFINFPYSAIIQGTVNIDRMDLMGLYIVYIISVALLEELIFRGVLLVLAKDYLKNNRHAPLLITLICAAIFSLFHLTNLFVGGAVIPTLVQCVYTFLIGAMLIVTMLKLKNIWLCILIHAIFNFGGMLVITEIASKDPHDTIFWILTIVSGVLCAGHIIFTLIKLDKDYVSRS